MKISALFSLLLLVSIQLHAQHWELTEMADMPEAVSNNAVVEGMVNGVPYVYSFSGIDSTKIYSGIHLKSWRYNTMTDTWEAIADLPDATGKIAAGASRVNNIIYIMGGYYVMSNGSEISSDLVHRYDPETNTYLSDGSNIPVATDDHVQCVWRDSLIYVVTGWSNSGNIPDVQIYNPTEDSWAVGSPIPNNHLYKSFGASGSIVGDTIFYFGGARSSGNFNIQSAVRKGVINPDDPTEIEWTAQYFTTATVGYRMAATTIDNTICWLGGSGVTYNFNGIAYNGSGGVSPLDRSLCFVPETGLWNINSLIGLNMDLRGVAEVNPSTRYLAGGMESGQMVSNKLVKLDWLSPTIVDLKEQENVDFNLEIYPNPVLETLYISCPKKSDELSLTIFDINGKLLKKRELESQLVAMDFTTLESGTYFLLFENEEGSQLEKIIKK